MAVPFLPVKISLSSFGHQKLLLSPLFISQFFEPVRRVHLPVVCVLLPSTSVSRQNIVPFFVANFPYIRHDPKFDGIIFHLSVNL